MSETVHYKGKMQHIKKNGRSLEETFISILPEEQKEIRLGRTLSTIRCTVLKRYEGKNLEEIENKGDRKIVKRIRDLEEKCKFSEKIENIQEER